jgi:WD40 repeat protein
LNYVSDLTFSPNSAFLASSGLDGQTILWNLTNHAIPEIIQRFPSTYDTLRQAAFSPDGRYLAITGAETDILIWDVGRKTQVRSLQNRGVPVRAISFYPRRTATLAALDANGMITTWDVTSGVTIGQPMSDGKVSNADFSPHLAFNPSGTQLFSAHDLSLTIWEVSQPGQGQKYVRTIVPSETLVNVAVSPDGRYVASATLGDIEVRYATLEGWRTSACAIANRDLSQSEWQQLILNIPYQSACAGGSPS